MENAKTFKELLDAAPLSDGDFLAVNQPDVFNPVTQRTGDTRRLTAKQMADFALDRLSADRIYKTVPFLTAASKQQLQIRDGTILKIRINGADRFFKANGDLILNIGSILDTGAIASGKDYYLFLVPDNNDVKFLLSLNKNAPSGYTADAAELIGGFHTLCVAAGTGLTYVIGGKTKDHPLNGYIAGDILPASVWCLNHRPYSEPEGMAYISSLDFWCDIYLQSGSGANTKSAYQGAITRARQYVDFVEDQFCVRKELLDDGEFAAAMLGSNEQTSVLGASEAGATSGGAGGRKDTASRRMVSVYGVEEGCGSLWQWLRTTAAGGTDGAMYGQTADNPSVTYGWLEPVKTAYGPYGQSGGKGKFWGLAGALLAGGHWDVAAGCGSRARTADIARSYAHSYIGGRGRSRPMRVFV
jgi:hypothetical protein